MITLYLLRHAKSGWEDTSLDDFDRPLAKRGLKEAAEVAELLRAQGYRPERIVCSTSLRTRETLAALLPVLSKDVDIGLDHRVYEAEVDALVAVIRECGASAAALMLIGHNPGLEELADLLIGGGERNALRQLRDKIPPAGLAVIQFEVGSWADVEAGGGRLTAFHTPAD